MKRSDEKHLREYARKALDGETRMERELATGILLHAALAHQKEAEVFWAALQETLELKDADSPLAKVLRLRSVKHEPEQAGETP